LKPEQWGSLLVQETYREGKACDKRHTHNNNNDNNNNIIIITIIIYGVHLKGEPTHGN
jgi:hypothetical protein